MMSLLALCEAPQLKACPRFTLKQMFGNPSWHPSMALDGLGALTTKPKLLGIINLEVLHLEEGTTSLKEALLKVVLFHVIWRCVPEVVWPGPCDRIICHFFPSQILKTRRAVHVLL